MDPLPVEKQSKVVYRITCSCGKEYICETKRRLETRLKEYWNACQRGMLEKSAIVQHAWKDHHSINWEVATVVDKAKHPGELANMEALHIHMTPAEECLNRHTGLEIPGCWMAALRKQEARTKLRHSETSGDTC